MKIVTRKRLKYQFTLLKKTHDNLKELVVKYKEKDETLSMSRLVEQLINEEYHRRYCQICGREAEKGKEENYCLTCWKSLEREGESQHR